MELCIQHLKRVATFTPAAFGLRPNVNCARYVKNVLGDGLGGLSGRTVFVITKVGRGSDCMMLTVGLLATWEDVPPPLPEPGDRDALGVELVGMVESLDPLCRCSAGTEAAACTMG